MGQACEVILSPLCQRAEIDGICIDILIHLDRNGRWALTVVDEEENAIDWDDSFETDREAFDEVMHVLKAVGVEDFFDPPEPAIH